VAFFGGACRREAAFRARDCHHGIEEFLEMKYIMLGGIQV
jgi:hypothetical protein